MITFTEEIFKPLLALIKTLAVPTAQEQLSAYSMILIEQLDESTTKFTTFSPKLGVFIRAIQQKTSNGWGNPGDTYLVSYSNFLITLTKFISAGPQSISIRQVGGAPVLYTNLVCKPSGEEDFMDSRTLVAYTGELSDFNPEYALLNQTLVPTGTIKCVDIKRLKKLADFGHFNPNAGHQGFLVRPSLLDIKFFTRAGTQAINVAVELSMEFNAASTSLEDFFLSYLYIDKITNLGTSSESVVSIFITPEWLIFKSEDGIIQCARAYNDENSPYLDSLLVAEANLYAQIVSPLVTREMNLQRLLKAVTNQEPSELDITNEILVLDDTDSFSLVISIASLRALEADTERSKVHYALHKTDGDFPPLCLGYDSFVTALEGLKNLWIGETQDLVLELHQYKVGAATRLMLKLYPVANMVSSTKLNCFYSSFSLGDKLLEPE